MAAAESSVSASPIAEIQVGSAPTVDGKLLDRLRREACKRFDFGHVVRTEAARMAQSAVLRRLVLFGAEDSANRYSAREILQYLAMCGGDLAVSLARIAASRAVVENDLEVLQVYADIGLFPDLLDWLALLQHGTEAQLTAHLARLDAGSDDLAVNRIAVGRRFPQCLSLSWLTEVASHQRILRFVMARLIAELRPDLHGYLTAAVAQHRDLLLGGDPDEILAPLLRHSPLPPQQFLAPFEGYYDEGSLIAAAEWHLEQGQWEPARELSQRIRVLSRFRDRAVQVQALLAIDARDLAMALALRDQCDDQRVAAAITLAVAQADASLVSTAELAVIAERDDPAPELLHRLVLAVLARRELTLARTIARNRWPQFRLHPVLGPILRTVDPSLGGA
jgi:hypothetical protein